MICAPKGRRDVLLHCQDDFISFLTSGGRLGISNRSAMSTQLLAHKGLALLVLNWTRAPLANGSKWGFGHAWLCRLLCARHPMASCWQVWMRRCDHVDREEETLVAPKALVFRAASYFDSSGIASSTPEDRWQARCVGLSQDFRPLRPPCSTPWPVQVVWPPERARLQEFVKASSSPRGVCGRRTSRSAPSAACPALW